MKKVEFRKSKSPTLKDFIELKITKIKTDIENEKRFNEYYIGERVQEQRQGWPGKNFRSFQTREAMRYKSWMYAELAKLESQLN